MLTSFLSPVSLFYYSFGFDCAPVCALVVDREFVIWVFVGCDPVGFFGCCALVGFCWLCSSGGFLLVVLRWVLVGYGG